MPIYILKTCTNMIIKKYNIVTLSLFLQPTYLISLQSCVVIISKSDNNKQSEKWIFGWTFLNNL